jgi:hypothetical protein
MKMSALFIPAPAYIRRLMRVFSSIVRTAAVLSGIALFLPLAYGQVSFFMTPTYPASENVAAADFNGDGNLDLVGRDGTVLLGKGNGTFTTGTKVNLPAGTTMIAEGDFNADGKADLLAVNGFNLSVLLGKGDGTFQAPTNTFTGVDLSQVVAADLKGNGILDIVGTVSSGILVFVGKGDGTFLTGVQYNTPQPEQIVTADFNGDGKADVAVSSNFSNGVTPSVTVFIGNGDGTFQSPKVTAEGLDIPVAMVSGDVNGDGKTDLLITDDFTKNTYFLEGNGDGTFQAPSDPIFLLPSITNAYQGAIAMGDFNGDGKVDLVIENLPFADILLGNGDGTFTWSKSYFLNEAAIGSANVVVADFNGDAKSDLAMAGAMLLGNGDGTFQAANAIDAEAFSPGPPSLNSVEGDFNGDGIPDIAALFSEGLEGFLFAGNGKGEFSMTTTFFPPAGYSLAAAADVNGDGKLDLILTSYPTLNLAVMLGNGNGTFQSPILSPGVSFGFLGDFNLDGKPDVAFTAFGSSDLVYISLGNGDGSFQPPKQFFAGSATGSVVAADFNGDGKLDVAVASLSGIAVLLGNGDGTLQAADFVVKTPEYAQVATADVNGDGKADLIFQETVLLGNGDGTFKTILQPQVTAGEVADINSDGKLDLVVTQPANNTSISVNVLLGNGDGTFGGPIPVVTGGAMAVADFNRDGRPDILAGVGLVSSINNSGGVAVLLNTTPPGTKADFQLSASALSPGTITAGGSAISTATVMPLNGFLGSVNLACTISPAVTPAPTCTVKPSSVQLTGNARTAQVTVATTAPVTTGTISYANSQPNARAFVWMMLLLTLGFLLVRRRRNVVVAAIPAMVLAVASWVGCGGGGGGGSSSSHTTPGTPTGIYTATVTATSGSLNHKTALTVVVQ